MNMNESEKNIETEKEPNIKPLGLALKELRESASLSILHVAISLNMTNSIIEDIEMRLDEVIDGDVYSTVYLRGYLLSYGKLVGLENIKNYDEYKKIAVHQKKEITFKLPDQLTIKNKNKNKNNWKMKFSVILTLIVVALIGVAVYFVDGSKSDKMPGAPSIGQVQSNNNLNSTNKTAVSKAPIAPTTGSFFENNKNNKNNNNNNNNNLRDNTLNAAKLQKHKPDVDKPTDNADKLKENKSSKHEESSQTISGFNKTAVVKNVHFASKNIKKKAI